MSYEVTLNMNVDYRPYAEFVRRVDDACAKAVGLKPPAETPISNRRYVIYNPFLGPRGLYLHLRGPYRYPYWFSDIKYSTPLLRSQAYQYVYALGDLHGELLVGEVDPENVGKPVIFSPGA